VTAPARPAPRTDRPPTREQLLVLADRAERGQLTAAEAARLRQGIAALYAGRWSVAAERRNDGRRHREAALRLMAAGDLVRTARQRGARSIPVQILAAVLQVGREGPREADE